MFTLGEINIICTDLDRSLTFYRDGLGFTVESEEGGAYHLLCGSQPFLLLPVAELSAPATPYCQVPTFSVDLMVDDLGAAVQHLKAHNVAFERDWQPNARSVIIRDPDGLVWEIIERRSG